MPALEKYRKLLNELIYIRWIHSGMESNEEDLILEKMDSAWENLTEKEKEQMQNLPSRSLIKSGSDRTILDTEPAKGPVRATFDKMEAA